MSSPDLNVSFRRNSATSILYTKSVEDRAVGTVCSQTSAEVSWIQFRLFEPGKASVVVEKEGALPRRRFCRQAAVGAWSPAGVTVGYGRRASRRVCEPCAGRTERCGAGSRWTVCAEWFCAVDLVCKDDPCYTENLVTIAQGILYFFSSEGIQNLIWDYRDKVRFGFLSRNSICRCQKLLMGPNCFRLKIIVGNCV